MHCKRSLFLTPAIVLLFVAAATLHGQFRARVDLVVVPVSVRDNNGVLITGLERDDFRILEDGKPQGISDFSLDAQPLSVAILIDDGISGNALRRVVSLLPSIPAPFKPDDEMTSYRYDHIVWKLSDFTNDHKQIETSFRELIQMADRRPEEPEPPALIDKIEKNTPGWLRALAGIFTVGSNGAPGSLPAAPAPRPAPSSRTMHSAVYEALVALQNRPADHRKIILLISDGAVSEPQISVIPGKTINSFNKNVELLLKSRIQVYSVYTAGTLLNTSAGILDSYARVTGGDVYGGRSASDMKFAFSRIAEQARNQYVLGYISSNSAPPQGIYRKIEVKSGDPDQKRTVIHRQGYIQYPIPQ
jgi:VWFA-related protein